MPEPRDARSIIESAEQAAAAGNYSAAESLLGEAAALQEQTLGSHHPDLANTLNNLGVVCEIADNPIDAEHYFRRAYAIATASLAADHPFVATSRKNLHDFCAARGRPMELPPSPPQVAVWLEASPPRVTPSREPSSAPQAAAVPQTAGRWSPRVLAVGALSAAAVLALVLAMTRPWGDAVEPTRPPAAAATAPTPPAPAPSAPAPAESTAPRRPGATSTPPVPSEVGAGGDEPVASTPSAAPTVVIAQLCTALVAWRCEPAGDQLPPGSVFFYTQIKSAAASTVEHRWYQDDRLLRTVRLRIQANPGTGYRTYSRSTVSGERGGDWRAELRSADGAVLHEQRFTVR